MTAWPCPEPVFVYHNGVWSACTACGRYAWEHEQADPLTDMRNTLELWQAGDGRSNADYPPTMKPAPED